MWTHVKTPPGWSSARFNLHSVATGLLSDLIAPLVDVEYPEGAFVAGLLHDVGKFLIAISLPSEYSCIGRLSHAGGRGRLDSEREVIGTTHAELSGQALLKWNLPEPIRHAVAYHHQPREAAAPLELAHVVWAADQLANEMGHSVMPPTASEPLAPSRPALESLGVAERVPALLQQFGAEFEELKALF
jgi:HD-like signal output (HDOD) protein